MAVKKTTTAKENSTAASPDKFIQRCLAELRRSAEVSERTVQESLKKGLQCIREGCKYLQQTAFI